MRNGTTSNVETITPEKASEYLGLVIENNRHEIPPAMSDYAADMKAGRWKLNGETIKFNSNGEIIDGANRLRACIKAGVDFTTVVVRGIESRGTFATIDTGRPRTLAHIITMHKEKNAKGCAALVSALLMYEKGWAPHQGGSGMTRVQEETFFLKNAASIRISVEWSSTISHRCKLLTPREFAFLKHSLSKIDEETATGFLDTFASGANIGKDDPVFILRKRMEKNMTDITKLSSVTKLAFGIKAWNATRTGEAIRCMKWSRYGKNREDFPVPV